MATKTCSGTSTSTSKGASTWPSTCPSATTSRLVRGPHDRGRRGHRRPARPRGDTEYALTAGLFSRSPVHIRRAADELRAGNVYVNRAITGAVVGRQPFGDYGMSGVGSKAGGPDYLLQFLDPRVVTENTMRQGFAPLDG
ncbi:MAG TPA: aldehyde dehydrogenase family protein [Acidimicrobiales bacterium]|nr:aldehyde dehydrogenase family protein [Acidimicrobiales bacterium]